MKVDEVTALQALTMCHTATCCELVELAKLLVLKKKYVESESEVSLWVLMHIPGLQRPC